MFKFFMFMFLAIAAEAADTGVIRLGSSLYARDDNSTWSSPSGDFALGFRPFPGQEDHFLLAIWFAKIPDKTIVWYANGNYPLPRESKLELTLNGQLLLEAPGGWQVWSTQNTYNIQPLQALMLDTGNFVIKAKDSSNIWESFREPTNTILPTQSLNLGDKMSSTLLENNLLKGKFQLQLLQRGLVLNQIDPITGNPYKAYVTIRNVSQLIFNASGYILANRSNNNLTQLASGSFPGNFYHRATLDFDGTLTHYIHPKASFNANASWVIVSVFPSNICLEILGQLGSGPCGYNSYCELNPYGKPNCGCPPGFSLLDRNNPYSGCKQDGLSYLQECDQEGSSLNQDRFEFLQMDGADWPLADFELLSPSSENDCTKSCLSDCYCAVAIYQDPRFNQGIGNCWKKKLPLSNGRLNRSAIDRRALFKVLKVNSSLEGESNPSSGQKDQKTAVLVLAILLGTSVLFNFFSVAVVSLAIFFICQRKMYNLIKPSEEGNFETNLHSYSYKDLEKATDNFKEVVGRGAFGSVYKGILPSNSKIYIAVKKLDKMVEDGQKEFVSEVNAIGQTHHKNLVCLLGYCDEGNNRLLVYEFMQNGSLSNFLFGSERLCWEQRVQIASGIARGLAYLHEECSKQIIHCDIKPQNILLDHSFTAKISDFGLAKLLIGNQSRTLTGIRGTKGYVAPDWFRNTPITAKVDVYSFGVMLLEIICCRRCTDFELKKEAILSDWAYECYSKGKVDKLVENDEEARSDLKRLEKMVMVAIWCVQDEPAIRPSMRTISLMLEGILKVSVPPCPFSYSSTSISSSDKGSSP